ncbi:MAG TPA: basic amino acid ABC transporter substrate-binding protein [Anaerolineae bacterium]|mgnify:CR=1 FL=1|nr:basic amino acid ABC transporter substrate-binding protein [Anaerolineae bacterium]HQH37443.1 basic amino acid ABC transporter substrate-binding protein [Anaerolineae bacterium]
MKFRRLSIFLVLVAVLVTSLMTGCQKQSAKIVVATDATWPPMEYVDENKAIVGFDIDLMNAIAQEAGLEVEYKNVAWDGIFAGLAAGEYDAVISSVTITDERKEQYDFSAPYINAGQIVVVQADSAITGPDTLSGHTVGAQISTTGAFAVQKMEGVTLKEYDEIGLAFEDLVAGRIDAVVCDTPVAADFALQREEYRAKLKIVGNSFTDEYYGILVQKGNSELLAKINQGLAAIQSKGIDKELENKWLR